MKKLLRAMKMAIVATLMLIAFAVAFVLIVTFLTFIGVNILLAIMITCGVMIFIALSLDAYFMNI